MEEAIVVTYVTDSNLERRLLAERSVTGADRYDEVWEGIYMMTPMPNDEHQQIVNRLASIFQEVVDWPGLGDVRPGINVSDRREGWTENYRVPDVAVFLKDGQAENCCEFWFGGPDFAVEIVSPGDQTQDKMPFYGKIGTREVLVVDREPWRIELLRLDDERRLVVASASELPAGSVIHSNVLPFSFRVIPGNPRPIIEVVQLETQKTWQV